VAAPRGESPFFLLVILNGTASTVRAKVTGALKRNAERGMNDLNLLRTFLVLIQERNVSRAALRLNLSQPALSHALARLRRMFNDPLLIRASGAMTPTARCLELRGEIEDLLARFDRLTTPAGEFDPAISRLHLTIMAPEFATDVIAPVLLNRIQQLSSTIDIEFITTDPIEAMGLLEQGAIDFRLGWWPQPAPALRRKLLWTDKLCCILREGHPLLVGSLTAEKYFNARHVRVRRPGRSYSMASIDDAAAKAGSKAHIAAWVQNAHSMAAVVANTDMIGTLSERLARQASHSAVQIRELPLDVPRLKVALYWHERTHRSPVHRWFRSLLFEVARLE
jgi:DNA-binding transcriptional LysR family regulator